jgi:hypothetical protein
MPMKILDVYYVQVKPDESTNITVALYVRAKSAKKAMQFGKAYVLKQMKKRLSATATEAVPGRNVHVFDA